MIAWAMLIQFIVIGGLMLWHKRRADRKLADYHNLKKSYDNLKTDRDALFNENFTLRTKINYKKQNVESQVKREIEREKAIKKSNRSHP